MANNSYIGLALDADDLRLAQLQVKGSKIHLSALKRITIAEPKKDEKGKSYEEIQEQETELDVDDLFGIDNVIEAEQGKNNNSVTVLDDLDLLTTPDSLNGIDEDTDDIADENLIYTLLGGISTKRIDLALNISTGAALFQILRDADFTLLKKKQVREIIDEKLEVVYGEENTTSQYTYNVRSDGSLLLTSVEKNSSLLEMIDQGLTLFPGKIFIHEILPSEAALLGLMCANYSLEDDEVTGIISFGIKTTRLIFLKGDQIWAVAPIITEGIHSQTVLKTVFSKILLQLDSGELPSLDRIIIANNSLGKKSVQYFQENFQVIPVEEFAFNPEKFVVDEELADEVKLYTTAIAVAWSATGQDADFFKAYSLLPSYIQERQKVFKLEWHGVLLLLLIAVIPVLFNYYYQINKNQIDQLNTDITRTEGLIKQIHTTVVGTQYLNKKYNQVSNQLKIIKGASIDAYKWGTILNMINNGTDSVRGCWITAMRSTNGGKIIIEGFSLYRNQIPKFASLFHAATLQQVSIQKIRNLEVNRFTLLVDQVVNDKKSYSP